MIQIQPADMLEQLKQAIADNTSLYDLLIHTDYTPFTHSDLLALGRLRPTLPDISRNRRDTWDRFESLLDGGLGVSKLGQLSYMIGKRAAEIEMCPQDSIWNHQNLAADYGTAVYVTENHPDRDVQAVATQVAAQLKPRLDQRYDVSNEVIVKTTPTIDSLNQMLATKDDGGIYALTNNMWQNPDQYTNLDFMAIGRASIVYPDLFFEALPKFDFLPGARLESRVPQKHHSFRMGCIRARIEESKLERNGPSTRPGGQGWTASLVPEFLAEAFAIAQRHPDPVVHRMAVHVSDYLGALHADSLNMG